MSDPRWYEIALGEQGVHETPGPESTARILEYFSATNHGAKDDETPWCSAFVNWCMRKAGITGTLSTGARSWATWGQELKTPVWGCVVVFGYPNSWHGHVGFYAGMIGEFIHVYGGNQSDKVCTIAMDKKLLLSYRWPNGVEIPKPEPKPEPQPVAPNTVQIDAAVLAKFCSSLFSLADELMGFAHNLKSIAEEKK